MFRFITRTVLLLSLISLMNDVSSEMLYPVVPLYLAQIGYGTFLIGMLEGVAELVAGLSKIYMGSLSDSFERRLPFVNIGYALSILSRPIIGLSALAGFIFLGRSMDKVGKGIRTGARDALLSDECNEENRAEVFGFHRSLDTVGAILGPLIAIIFLSYYPKDYKTIFLITMIPGVVAVFLSFLIKEKKRSTITARNYSFIRNFSFYKTAPKQYLSLLILLLVFSLANSSDMFLLLKTKEIGVPDNRVIMLYMLFNLVYAVFAFPIGKMADRFGREKMLIYGLVIYAITYFIFGFSENLIIISLAFIGYGLFYAFSQSTIKALLLQQVDPSQKAGAIGFYEGLNSFCLLASNAIAGFVWYRFGANVMFISTAVLVTSVMVIFMMKKK